ncbi:MAG: radical SAM protein [Elusimicrobiota bacterium]
MNNITLVNITIAKNFDERVVYKHNTVGIFLLIASLEKAGYNVSFSEFCLDHKKTLKEEIDSFINTIDTAPHIIGIGCHLVHLPFVVRVSEELKKRFPEKMMLLGGIGPSGVAEQLVRKFEFIDVVAVGEAEDTIVEVVASGSAGLKDIKGIVYRQNGEVYVNERRPHITDLDRIPKPAYHIIDFSKQYQIASVLTQRGCPFGCHFCSLSHFDGSKVRFNSIENVVEEMIMLDREYGMKHMFFVDPTFTVNKQRTLDLCRRIKMENLSIKWFCMTRAECMDEELLEALSTSGCETIFYGLDTGSNRVLEKIKRGDNVEKWLEIIKKSTDYIDIVETGLMWGFPFETLDDFKDTLDIRRYLEEDLKCGVQLRWLEPYPVTKLYEQYKGELFLPLEHSCTFQPDTVKKLINKSKEFYKTGSDVARIPTDVTSLRFVIAACHTADMCRDLIQDGPDIFCDYYRYKTPDLEKKLELAGEFSIY